MYEAGGGGFGDGDLLRILDDEERRPSSGAIIRMSRFLGTEKDDYRTINTDDAWNYFYELLEKFSNTLTIEQLYESLASYLSPAEIEEYLSQTREKHRKTA
jgi:hypothetical protein